MSRNYLYSVTDKALSDALNQSQISNNELRDLFLSRGILVNKITDRKLLAKNYSRYNHDYYDHQKIASALGSKTRKEKITASFLPLSLPLDSIEQAAEKLRDKINSESDLCHIVNYDERHISIEITYESICYSKSDFKQVVSKHATIELEKSDDHYVIRRPDNDYVKEYEQELLMYLNNELQSDKDVSNEKISLLNIEDDKLRTDFFISLIRSFDDYQLDDVTDVYVFKPKCSDNFSSDHDELECDSSIQVGHITRVSLKGESVLSSGELDSLREKNFYICKIRWKIKEKCADPDIFEFEAQFGNPENCEDFSFMSKGAIRYKANGEYYKGIKKLTDEEEIKFNRIIEESALRIMRKIVKSALGEENNGSSTSKVE
ncbi:TPA: hypothetical protein ACX6SR_000126 [Photobacterium damselae]